MQWIVVMNRYAAVEGGVEGGEEGWGEKGGGFNVSG